jgi:hypothetical protein
MWHVHVMEPRSSAPFLGCNPWSYSKQEANPIYNSCDTDIEMPPKEANPFGNPKPFLRAAAAGSAEAAASEPSAPGGDSAAAPQKSKKQMHRKDKVHDILLLPIFNIG